MVNFKCGNCGAEFSVGDDVYDTVMIYCPCCGNIYSNPLTDDCNHYIKFVLEDVTIHLKPLYKVYEEQDLVKNVIKDGKEREELRDIFKGTVDMIKKYEKEWKSEDVDKAMREVYDNYESEDKNVSHPSHYQSKNGLEVIDVIAAFTEGLEGIEATDTGNVIKYICRWKNKNGIQDLEKAMWYLQHLINYTKGKGK